MSDPPATRGAELPAAAASEWREAAVLVPIFRDEAGQWRLVLVRRSERGIHGGQLAFPGGGIEPHDATPLEAALREAREEIGLEPERVRVVGELPGVETQVSRYRITPFLATISPPERWQRNEREVAEVLEPPLAAFTAPGARGHSADLLPPSYGGAVMPCYEVGSHRLWGVSERILTPLLGRISAGEWPELAPEPARVDSGPGFPA